MAVPAAVIGVMCWNVSGACPDVAHARRIGRATILAEGPAGIARLVVGGAARPTPPILLDSAQFAFDTAVELVNRPARPPPILRAPPFGREARALAHVERDICMTGAGAPPVPAATSRAPADPP